MCSFIWNNPSLNQDILLTTDLLVTAAPLWNMFVTIIDWCLVLLEMMG